MIKRDRVEEVTEAILDPAGYHARRIVEIAKADGGDAAQLYIRTLPQHMQTEALFHRVIEDWITKR